MTMLQSKKEAFVVSIEHDIKSNKHKKDPFLQKYVDLTTSNTTASGNVTGSIESLSRDVKLRTCLLTAQISALSKELENVTSENASKPKSRKRHQNQGEQTEASNETYPDTGI